MGIHATREASLFFPAACVRSYRFHRCHSYPMKYLVQFSCSVKCLSCASSAPSSLASTAAKYEPIRSEDRGAKIQNTDHGQQGDEYMSTFHPEGIVTQLKTLDTTTPHYGPEYCTRKKMENPNVRQGKHDSKSAREGHIDAIEGNQHNNKRNHVIFKGVAGEDDMPKRVGVGGDEVGF